MLVRQISLFEELLKRGEISLLKNIIERLVKKACLCKTLMRFVLLIAQSDFEWAFGIVKTLLKDKDLLGLSRYQE